MFKNAMFIPLCAGVFLAATATGCFFFSEEDCSTQNYCRNDALWIQDGTMEFGCDEYIEQDCSESGQVCRTYDDGAEQQADCFYPAESCEPNVRATCDHGILYQCASDVSGAAYSQIACADTGRSCVEYSDKYGQTAGCFYDDVICAAADAAAPAITVCKNDFAYSCDAEAAMADKRVDCREAGRICVQTDLWGAVCTQSCSEEGESVCTDDATAVLQCRNGLWIPEIECGAGRKCVPSERDGVTEPLCVDNAMQ